MENTKSNEDKKKSTLGSRDTYSELLELISDASRLDQRDLKRLEAMDNLSIEKGENIDWKFFSIMAMRGLLYGYENGELDFKKMMQIARECTLPLIEERLQFHVMGALSALALRITPKERIAKRPPFATWVKIAVGNLGLLLEQSFPNLKKSHNTSTETVDTIPSLILKQLALFDLHIGEGGNHLSEKTIYEWICDYKHENNIPLKNTGPKSNIF